MGVRVDELVPRVPTAGQAVARRRWPGELQPFRATGELPQRTSGCMACHELWPTRLDGGDVDAKAQLVAGKQVGTAEQPLPYLGAYEAAKEVRTVPELHGLAGQQDPVPTTSRRVQWGVHASDHGPGPTTKTREQMLLWTADQDTRPVHSGPRSVGARLSASPVGYRAVSDRGFESQPRPNPAQAVTRSTKSGCGRRVPSTSIAPRSAAAAPAKRAASSAYSASTGSPARTDSPGRARR